MSRFQMFLSVAAILLLSSCFSSQPECEDVTNSELLEQVANFQSDRLFKENMKLRDSLKAYFRVQKNDSISRLQEGTLARLDSLYVLRSRETKSILAKLDLTENPQLIKETENSGLTSFSCICSIDYELDGQSGSIEYRLTNSDYNSETDLEVTYSSLKFQPILNDQSLMDLVK